MLALRRRALHVGLAKCLFSSMNKKADTVRHVVLQQSRSSNLAPDVLRYQLEMLLAKGNAEAEYLITDSSHLSALLFNLEAVNDRALVREPAP